MEDVEKRVDEKMFAMMNELAAEERRKSGADSNIDSNPSNEESDAVSLLAPKQEAGNSGEDAETAVDVTQPLVSIAGKGVPFSRTELIKGVLYAYLPRTFRLMPKQEACLKYPSEYRPSLIYTNDTGAICLTFQHTKDPIPEQDVAGFTDTMMHVLRSAQPIRSWIGHGLAATRDGLPAGYCEFITRALDGPLYHYMLFTEWNGSALLCSFNCPEAQAQAWKPVAKSILKALEAAEEQKGAARRWE